MTVGRPATIKVEEVAKLCAMQCTQAEIAAFFGVSKQAVEQRIADHERLYPFTLDSGERTDLTFREIMDLGYSKGKISQRRALLEAATKGNVTAMIWFGKQFMDQRDNLDSRLSGPDGRPLMEITTARLLLHSADDSGTLPQVARVDPVEFQRRFLGRNLWAKERDIVRAVRTKRSTSVKGCHGSGKSYTVAGCVPDELLAGDGLVLTIAPTLRQVKNLWSEIESAIQRLPVRVPERTTTGWEISENCKAIGFSSSKGVNAQGFHAKDVLIIADEAIGIAQELWDAVEGIRAAGNVRMVKLCNPTVPEGAPYEDFTKLRGSTECITISAFDTPNLAGLTMESLLQLPEEELDIAPFPWLTRRRWVKEMYHKWGPSNPRFMSRVLGEFPTQASDAVFQLAWIEKAARAIDDEVFAREFRNNRHRITIQIGLDIAGPGDDETSACARIGPFVVEQVSWPIADPFDQFMRFLSRLHQRFPQVPIIIMADVVGIGYHFARAIARHGYDVREFLAGASAIDSQTFSNAKAEAYWNLREIMRTCDISGATDDDCQAQLSDVRYRERPNGQIEIEHKDQARSRGSSSPDRAEAMIMAFQRVVPKVQEVDLTEYVEISPI